MRFELELEEINKILSLLGETPTKMGFYPLMEKLAAQGNAQNTPTPTEPSPNTDAS